MCNKLLSFDFRNGQINFAFLNLTILKLSYDRKIPQIVQNYRIFGLHHNGFK
jgi:hypothetical protein